MNRLRTTPIVAAASTVIAALLPWRRRARSRAAITKAALGIGTRVAPGAISVVIVLAVLVGSRVVTDARAQVVPISIGPVSVTVFPNPGNSGPFDPAQLSNPQFTQQHQIVAFNPSASLASLFCSNALGINEHSRPFTGVSMNGNGTCSTTPLEGNGNQAGVASLTNFQASMEANLTVSTAGNHTLQFTADDGWILGAAPRVGGSEQPAYVSGALLNPTSCSPVKCYQVVGAMNRVQSPTTSQVTVNFPAAGVYPIEIAYTECCSSPLMLIFQQTSGVPIPPTSGGPPPSGPTPAGQSNGVTTCGAGGWALTGDCVVAEPVNTRTGFFVHQEQDLATPGTGVPFEWMRSYTSGDATVGTLGAGWTHTYAASLQVQGNGDVLARGEEGQEVYFTKQANGSFVGAAGARAALSSVAGGYELRRTDQVVYAFNTQGRLLSIKDRNAQGVTLDYDGQGRLATITDAANRQTTVSYNASNLVSQVSTVGGRSVSYGYTSGRLTSFTDVRDKNWTYTYDAGGRLATIVDPLTHTQVTNVYDPNGRVTSQTDAVNKTAAFAWDAGSELATVTDANNKVWKHDYADGVLAKEIDPLDHETQLGHDADLNETAVTSPTSQQTTMTYDAAGNLLTATAPPSLGNAQKTFAYNSKNDPTQVTDARSKVTSHTYTPAGNVETVTQDGIQVAAYTYDTAGRVLTFTDGNEKTTTYTYFPTTGYLESSTDPLGNKTTYTYDAAGRVESRVDPKGNVAGCGCAAQFTWTYTYNPAGQQLTETDPLGHVTTNVYDDAGRLTSATDANNHTTSYTYDNANRILTETAPDPDGGGPLTAPVTTYTYDDVGNKLTETDPRGNTTTFAYNDANQLISETEPDPDGGGPLAAPVTTYTYDANANLASTVEPRGNAAGANPSDFRTTYTYNAAGRQLTETRPDPDGAGPASAPVATNVYDLVGNLQSVTDGNNHTTSYTHDAAGRILTVTAPDLGVTTYDYDDAGNVLTREDAKQHTTTYAYDNASRVISETSPDPDGPGPQGPAVTGYTYDPNGNRLTLTDPNGNATGTAGDGVTTHGYDRANRLTSINYSDSTPDATFTYDNAGNRVTMADGQGTETRTYDNLDRVLGVTRGSNTFSYAYDPAGNVLSRTYPGGIATTYGYDALDRMRTVTRGEATTILSYDPAGNLTASSPLTDLLNEPRLEETRAYDRAGRLTSVHATRSVRVPCGFAICTETTPRTWFDLTLDPAGNPTRIDRSGDVVSTTTYGYDASDRLTSVCYQASCPGGSDPFIRWTYDKVGNRLTEQRPSGTTTYGYDARDRLLSAGSTNYTYNQNGNELSAGSRTFTYDLANRLKTTLQGNTTTTYTYDGDGVRLQASTGSQANKKTNFVWDINGGLPQVALERDGNNNLLRNYIYGQRRLGMVVGSSTFHHSVDGLGSVSQVTDATSVSPQWTYSYDPFGATKTATKNAGSAPDNFMKFTGEYLDPTGLYHLRARQYDPPIGRFLQLDPLAPSTGAPYVSSYAYVSNRPTTFVDPSGMKLESSNAGQLFARLAARRTELTLQSCASHYPMGLRVLQGPLSADAPSMEFAGCGPGGLGDKFVPDLWFRPACNFHDKCYGGESRYYDWPRSKCDREFFKRMENLCENRFGTSNSGVEKFIGCRNTALTYYEQAKRFGEQLYYSGHYAECLDRGYASLQCVKRSRRMAQS